MWDFTRALLSFSWAMSLFGMQQFANLLAPSRGAKAFREVTQATEAGLSNDLKTAFKAGDNLQKRLIDQTQSTLSGTAAHPNTNMPKPVASVKRQWSDDAEPQSTPISMESNKEQPSLTPAVPGAQRQGAASASDEVGWGPMPDVAGSSGSAASPRPGTPSATGQGTEGSGSGQSTVEEGWGPMPGWEPAPSPLPGRS